MCVHCEYKIKKNVNYDIKHKRIIMIMLTNIVLTVEIFPATLARRWKQQAKKMYTFFKCLNLETHNHNFFISWLRVIWICFIFIHITHIMNDDWLRGRKTFAISWRLKWNENELAVRFIAIIYNCNLFNV